MQVQSPGRSLSRDWTLSLVPTCEEGSAELKLPEEAMYASLHAYFKGI